MIIKEFFHNKKNIFSYNIECNISMTVSILNCKNIYYMEAK